MILAFSRFCARGGDLFGGRICGFGMGDACEIWAGFDVEIGVLERHYR